MMEKRAPLIVSQPKSQPAKRKPCLQLFQTKGGVGRKKPLPISFSPTLICLGHALPPSLSNSSRHIRSFLFLFLGLRGAPACRGKKGKKGERERNPIRSTSLRFRPTVGSFRPFARRHHHQESRNGGCHCGIIHQRQAGLPPPPSFSFAPPRRETHQAKGKKGEGGRRGAADIQTRRPKGRKRRRRS